MAKKKTKRAPRQKRKLTAAEKRARRERKMKFMISFINGKQVWIPRPQMIEGVPVDEFIARNADPIWLHENELWELMSVEPAESHTCLRDDSTGTGEVDRDAWYSKSMEEQCQIVESYPELRPIHFQEFIAERNLEWRRVEIPKADDLSGLGASFEILDKTGAAVEAHENYPGILVNARGFVPIGGCLRDSGDHYFINQRDEAPGPVYRINHAAFYVGCRRNEAIVPVLQSYAQLLRYVDGPV